MRCWQCGAEPEETFEISNLEDAQPRIIPGRWPPGDHQHAVRPPTPSELEQAGHAALTRLLAEG